MSRAGTGVRCVGGTEHGRELEQFVYYFQNFNLFKQVYPPSLLQERINTKTIWKIIKAFFVFAYFNFNYFNFKNVVPYLAYSSGDMAWIWVNLL